MDQKALVKKMASNFTIELLREFLRQASDQFKPEEIDLSTIVNNNDAIKKILKIGHIDKNILQVGHIDFDEVQQLIIVVGKMEDELTSRSSKARQYRIGKEILKQQLCEAGIFVFHDDLGNFRFSLITANYFGQKREFSYYRRYTYFVSPSLTNKTFAQQIGKAEFSSIENIQKAFSIEAVTNDFYGEFKPKFDMLTNAVKGEKASEETKQNFALLFVIRCIFIGFVQKRGWLGPTDFILGFWQEYNNKKTNKDSFYRRWLEPLFFEALNTPPGHKVMYGNNEFSKATEDILQMAPYLNGELFKRINDIDDHGLYLPDLMIGEFIDFLFQYNFTVEENNRYDEELELNPEFLGIIFERLVNKADGAVYTPRIEVDYMCRLALVKWLEKNSKCKLDDLYYLFFREEDANSQIGDLNNNSQDVNLSEDEIRELCRLLENVTICDPAAGSGAFEVGMLQVLTEVLQYLQNHSSSPVDMDKKDSFSLKKDLIANCLYGVEIKPWAVWINQLRLWLTLFIDMPDEYRNSFEPLLPSLNFKIRCGDSLVQQIAGKTFPVQKHAGLSSSIKRKITGLKKDKVDFFYNRIRNEMMIKQKEVQIFRDILDDEIMKKENTILFYENKDNYSQESIFDEEIEKKLPSKTVYDSKMLDELKKEIEMLREQKKLLQSEYPFIWNIEFAEVFFQDNNRNRQGFDIIIGNPPYVRQEDINDASGKLSPAEYKSALIEMAKSDYDYFAKGKKIDGHSDLYTYFFLRSLRLLNPNGIHCFICSNSWLNVGYGVWLKEFFLNNVFMHFIIDNHAKRSFASADINTVITIFDAPNKFSSENLIKFVAFLKPFEKTIYTETLLEIESISERFSNDTYRIFPVEVEQLLNDGSDSDGKSVIYTGDKWEGKYLKAPDIFFKILEKGEGKLIKLKEVADVRFGIKTGCNEFFYLTEEKAMSLKIEDEFLVPIIKSSRECRTMQINPKGLNYMLFMCNKPKSKLKGTNALKYIQWGEKQNYNTRPSVRSRNQWYSIGERNKPDGVIPCSYRQFYSVYLNSDVFVDKRLYELESSQNIKKIIMILNSIIYPLMLELTTKSYGGGGGPIDATVIDIKNILIIDPDLISDNFGPINFDIPRFDIFTECGIDPESEVPIEKQDPNPMPHRAALDKIVFDALDLTEEERCEVYRAVCRLVWDRVSKARSV